MGERNESSRDSAEVAAIDSERDRLEANFRQIVESIPVPVAVTTPTGEVETLNGPTLEYFGLTLEHLKGWQTSEAVHPDDLQHTISAFLEAHEKGVEYYVESRHRRFDGTYRWFNVHGLPLRDPQGNILRWFHLLIDIDDRKKAEEKVRASERKLDEIIHTIPALAWSARPDGSADFFNQHYLDYLGLSAEQAEGSGWAIAVHSDDLDTLFYSWQQIMASEKPGETEARLRRHDGAYRWFLFRANPLRNDQGKIVKWYGANTDIEDWKKAQEALTANERDLRSIIDTIPTHIYVLNTEGYVQQVNQAVMDYTGLTLEDVQQSDYRDRVIHPEDFKRVLKPRAEGLRRGAPFSTEQRVLGIDGQYRWFLVRYKPVLNEQGSIVRWYVAALDMEDQKRAEAERKQLAETFRTIVETNPECVKVIDREGTLQRVNAAGLAMSGAPSEEAIIGQCFYDFVAPEDRDRYREFNEKVCSGHKGFLEFDLINAKGDLHHMETHAAPMLDADGSIVQLGVTRDITERKRTLEKLQANQDLLELAQKSAGAIAFDWHIQDEINIWSEEQEALYGLRLGEFDGTYAGWKKLIHQDDWPAVLDAIGHAHETGNVDSDFRVVWPDGSLHWLSTRGRMFFDSGGSPLRMVGFTSDITPRKIAELQLAGEKRLLEMVATGKSLDDILAALCTYVEEIAPECRCGVNLLDWSGPRFRLPVAPSLPADYSRAIKGLPVKPEVGPCATAISLGTQTIVEDLRSDPQWQGSAFSEIALAHGLISCWSTPIFSLSGRVLGSFAVYQDRPAVPTSLQQDLIAQVAHIASIAIDRSQREDSLRQSEAFLAEGAKLARIGNFAWNVATNKITWSEQAYRIYEIEPGTPITLELIRTRVHPEDASLFEKMMEYAAQGVESFEWQYRLLMPDQSVKYLYAVVRATRDRDGQLEYIAAAQDITARRLSQEALDQARSDLAHVSRITSLGALTASIAHEINQPLSGIITNASTCLRMLSAEPPNAEGAIGTAKRIVRDGNRASDVITRLRSLFGKNEVAGEPINLNDAAQEVIALSRRELQANKVVLKQELLADLPLVTGDRVQLQQVILNLLLNASNAMEDVEDRPKELEIKTQRDAKDYVLLTVKDTGIGFDPQNKDKLFEAFYTTKKSGMGIGLHVSRSIIENHHGRIWAVKNEGPGATFAFAIPSST